MMEDSLAEDRHSPVPGLVHRYPDRVLMLVTTQCASYCRYCTRSRIVGDPTQNFNSRDHEAQLDYLRRTPQVRDVLISGGDGLTLAPKLFEKILRGLREIPHIEIIRIGIARAGVPAAARSTTSCARCSQKYHPLWINLHFNHPNEITPEVARAVDKLTRAGIPVGNQWVLLAGVNDCVHIQRALVHQLVENRVRPYYLYQCDLVEGSGHFRTPVGKGLEIIEGLRGHTSGYAVPDLRDRRARWRRQDPGHAQLPDQLLATTRSCCATTRATSRRTRSRDLRAARQGSAASPASTSARSPASPASSACSRASGCGSSRRGFEEVHARGNTEAHRLQDPSKWMPVRRRRDRGDGVGAALPVLEAGDPAGNGAAKPGLRARRGAAAARGRADRLGPRGAALASASDRRRRGVRA